MSIPTIFAALVKTCIHTLACVNVFTCVGAYVATENASRSILVSLLIAFFWMHSIRFERLLEEKYFECCFSWQMLTYYPYRAPLVCFSVCYLNEDNILSDLK
jgi:hypothetical protein